MFSLLNPVITDFYAFFGGIEGKREDLDIPRRFFSIA